MYIAAKSEAELHHALQFISFEHAYDAHTCSAKHEQLYATPPKTRSNAGYLHVSLYNAQTGGRINIQIRELASTLAYQLTCERAKLPTTWCAK